MKLALQSDPFHLLVGVFRSLPEEFFKICFLCSQRLVSTTRVLTLPSIEEKLVQDS